MDHERTPGSTRWAVRGIPVELQREVAEAADLVGMKLGRWVERALRDALAHQRAALQEASEYGADEQDETADDRHRRRKRALRLAQVPARSLSISDTDLEILANAVASRLAAGSAALSTRTKVTSRVSSKPKRMPQEERRQIIAALNARQESQREIARRFGYSQQRISQIAKELASSSPCIRPSDDAGATNGEKQGEG